MSADIDIYRALQQHLDKGPYGFAGTPSGADIALLKQLFSPPEARIAVHLSLIRLEPAGKIHRRLKKAGEKMTLDELKQTLDRCIGCGNCVVTCEPKATRLVKKDLTPIPPKDKDATNLIMLAARLDKWEMRKLRFKMLLGMDV